MSIKYDYLLFNLILIPSRGHRVVLSRNPIPKEITSRADLRPVLIYYISNNDIRNDLALGITHKML